LIFQTSRKGSKGSSLRSMQRVNSVGHYDPQPGGPFSDR
jgi:hypothetical protein